jgi:hypothetical protein
VAKQLNVTTDPNQSLTAKQGKIRAEIGEALYHEVLEANKEDLIFYEAACRYFDKLEAAGS